MSKIIDKISKENEKKEKISSVAIGDTVKVHTRIREGDKDRVQIFAGTVIAKKGRGSAKTFTVRRVSYGVGMERVFPLHSPQIVRVDIEKSARVRRAKLYFLRELTGKKARLTRRIRAN